MSTIGVVDVSVSAHPSSPPTLPARRFAGGTLLEWVSQRITDVQAIDETVILLPQDHSQLCDLAPSHIPVHLSKAADPLAQMYDLCEARGADAIVRVRIDSPFVDPVLVDQLICTASESCCDYATYCRHGGKSAIQAQLGFVAEWIRAEALQQAESQATGETRQCPTRYIWTTPEQFHLKFISLPKLLDREDLRLVVNGEEDWEHAQQIIDALGVDDLDYQRIAGLLEEQPRIRQRMAALNETD